MCSKRNNDCRLRLDTRAPFLVPCLSFCTARDTCFPPHDATIRHFRPVVPNRKGCGSRLRRQHESRELIPSPWYGWSHAWRCAHVCGSDQTLQSWSLFQVCHTSSIAAILRKAVRVGPQTSRITVLAKKKHDQSDCVDARMALEAGLFAHDDQTQKKVPKCCHREQVREPRSKAARHAKTTACSLCAAREKCSHQMEGQEQPPEPQACRWATPPYNLVGRLSSAFSWPVQVFFSSRSTDVLQTSHRPQKMMPCNETSLITTINLSIS